MGGYDPTRHHRRSIRLAGFDYGGNGGYFITICTGGRERLFGRIRSGRMHLNAFGEAARLAWLGLEKSNPQIRLDTFVIMPDHFHGILLVCDACLHRKHIGRLIGAFKTVSTKRINQMRKTPGNRIWQRNYYETVIRNERHLHTIRQYIVTNPSRWHDPP